MRNKLEARDKVIVDEALIRQCIQLEDRFAEEIAATARDEGTTGGAWQESGAGYGVWAPPLWCLLLLLSGFLLLAMNRASCVVSLVCRPSHCCAWLCGWAMGNGKRDEQSVALCHYVERLWVLCATPSIVLPSRCCVGAVGAWVWACRCFFCRFYTLHPRRKGYRKL